METKRKNTKVSLVNDSNDAIFGKGKSTKKKRKIIAKTGKNEEEENPEEKEDPFDDGKCMKGLKYTVMTIFIALLTLVLVGTLLPDNSPPVT